jgi:anti-sigma B factor antagonist
MVLTLTRVLKPPAGRDEACPAMEQTVTAVVAVDGRNASVVVSGEVDIASVDTLRSALQQALASRPEALTVDLTAVTFIDSTGLAALVKAGRALPEPERMTVVLEPQSYPRVVFDATGLAHALTLVAPA